MPYVANRLKIVPFGHIDNVQTWSTTVQCLVELDVNSWGLSDVQAVSDDLVVYFNTWAVSLLPIWSPDTTYEGIRCYYYGSVGDHAELQAESQPANPPSGSNSAWLPTYTSLVASFRTPMTGRSGRGRSYVPLTGATLAAGGQVAAGDCTRVGNAFVALLQALNAYSNATHHLTNLTPCVMSATKSLATPIASIIVDSLPDTQHRREDKLSPQTRSTWSL